MYYDSLYYKMLPGIFFLINNKSSIGYYELFNYLKKIICVMIENKYERIKWKTYTTDFEVALHSIFGHIFNFIPNLHYVDCFFHYLNNIRNRLIQDGFTSKENSEHYDYLIEHAYKLPFKK